MLNRWETAVALAREVSGDCEVGQVDASRVARLARAVVTFQEGLLGGAPRSTAGTTRPEAELGRTRR